jgi:magnesium-transporting ATPase (P-type)
VTEGIVVAIKNTFHKVILKSCAHPSTASGPPPFDKRGNNVKENIAMVFSPLFTLYIVIVFSFLVTSFFMFKPKGNETVHIIFFWLAVALSCLVTFINATSLPLHEAPKIIAAWCGLLFSAVGIIVRMITGKTNAIANVLVMLSTIYGCAGYFLLN